MEVKFLPSKTRVPPIKQQVIPRSKLPGALIATRRVSSLLKSLPREIKPTFWVDSTTILCWILHDKPWKHYVQSRVQEIPEIVPQATWKHCSGDKNPAELPSRGLTGKKRLENSFWWSGPEFLRNPDSDCPKAARAQTDDKQAMAELVKCPPQM